MAVIDVRITKNGQLKPSLDPVPLSKSKGETINWHNDSGTDIQIDFTNGTPFPGSLNPYDIKAGGQKNSGPIQAQPNPRKTWDYTIRASSGAVADPGVIIQY
ncbi:MAG: hypothetical protein ACE14M_05785 [Terriglobales bacterium]